MTLRTRLVAAFTVLLLVVIASLGVVVMRSSRTVLTRQVDEDLIEIQSRIEFLPGRFRALVPLGQIGDPTQRSVARLLVAPDGSVVFAEPSGFANDSDPLPDTSEYLDLLASGDIITIDSDEGSMRYRAFGEVIFEGLMEVWAAPLDEVDTAVANILNTLLLTGLGVALIGGAVTWWTVQRELRPVDQMVDTATAIAAGDFTRRVPDSDPSTELGRLGTALNRMLGQIEDAFEHERTANQRLKHFVADASHELRTPIAAIRGYAELYRKGALEQTNQLDNAMRRVGTEASRMEHLVEDLLLLAQLDRGQGKEHRSVNLTDIVSDAITNSEAIEPNRTVTYDGPASLHVMGDEQRLAQVVANLLANARMHTPKGTPVLVTLSAENGQATLEVLDEGPGLPDGDDAKLFDRFYRADTSRARTSGGSGLGLAIVEAIVRGHGGTVEARNEDGHGARFTVTLPASEVELVGKKH